MERYMLNRIDIRMFFILSLLGKSYMIYAYNTALFWLCLTVNIPRTPATSTSLWTSKIQTKFFAKIMSTTTEPKTLGTTDTETPTQKQNISWEKAVCIFLWNIHLMIWFSCKKKLSVIKLYDFCKYQTIVLVIFY